MCQGLIVIFVMLYNNIMGVNKSGYHLVYILCKVLRKLQRGVSVTTECDIWIEFS